MAIIWLLIIGAAAGFVATRLMGEEAGLIPTIVIGMVGALIGGLILRFILMIGGALGGFVGAVLGAVVVVWLWQKYKAR